VVAVSYGLVPSLEGWPCEVVTCGNDGNREGLPCPGIIRGYRTLCPDIGPD